MSLSASATDPPIINFKQILYEPLSTLLSIRGCSSSTQSTTTTTSTNKNNKWTKRRRSRNDVVHHQSDKHCHIKLHPVLNSSLVIINLVYLIICVSLITTIPCSAALIVDPLLGGDVSVSENGGAAASVDSSSSSKSSNNAANSFSMDDALNRFNMENQIAAIFSRVSYGSTTTKRSISDLVGQSSLTTIPTPFLTTNR